MRAYSLKKAKEMVEIYNETASIHKVSEELRVPLPDAKKIMRWLHEHDSRNAQAFKGGRFKLRIPDSHIWVQFLYVHNIPAHTAAACCNWPLQRLLESCGGPEEWAKTGDRKPINLHVNDVTGGREPRQQRDEDPSPEQIALAASQVRDGWSPTDPRRHERKVQARVEVRQYDYDSRTGIFE